MVSEWRESGSRERWSSVVRLVMEMSAPGWAGETVVIAYGEMDKGPVFVFLNYVIPVT